MPTNQDTKDIRQMVVLEWSYSPANYFETAIAVRINDCEITIANGSAKARIKPNIFDSSPALREELHTSLDNRFKAKQFLAHKPYELSKPSMSRIHPDGKKEVFIFPESINCLANVGIPDLVVKDSDGNIISDTKAGRIAHTTSIMDLVSRFAAVDPILSMVLDSYKASVHDPANELIHLYEIRDAMKTRFDNDRSAQTALGIDRRRWSRLGQLANNEPIRQGRHRGQTKGNLRDASEEELQDARGIARELIERYLRYLEAHGPAQL